MNRRKFIHRTLFSTFGLGVLSGFYTWQIEPFWLEFVQRKMPMRNLPKHLIGKTIMQISDMHVGDRFDFQYIIDSFKKAQKFNPDFVVYTGDFVNYENKEQFGQLQEVLKHAVLGKIGTLGVLGNHDYGAKWSQQKVADKVNALLEDAGIKMLSNQSVDVGGLRIIGFDDYWSLNFNPQRAMKHYDPFKATIVLCHNPDVCDLNIWNNYKGWILSGHTHGGQCKPPFLKAPILPVKNKRYSSGEINLNDGRMLYINRAVGHLRQVRFNVRPEITIFKLEELN